MRAFVTGGTGFVGSNLVAGLLDRGIQVRILHRQGSPTTALSGLDCQMVVGDILDPVEHLADLMKGCDWVFHTAAISDYWRCRSRRRLYQVNIGGTARIAQAALRAGVSRYVQTSSLGALGIPPIGGLLTETDQFNLKPHQFPYGYSKLCGELEVHDAISAGLPAVIVNPAGVIGARDVHRIAFALLEESASGRLLVAAPGGVNFVAVEDVVAGHIAAAEHGRIGQRYILGGENLAFSTLFSLAADITGGKRPLVVLPRWMMPVMASIVGAAELVAGAYLPVDAEQMRLSTVKIYADTTLARQELGIKPTPIRTALQQAYQWYCTNGYLS